MAKFGSILKISLLSLALPCALLMPATAMAAPQNTSVSGFGNNSASLNNASVHQDFSVNTGYHYRKGVKDFNKGNYERADKAFKEVLRAKPHDANTNFYVARVKAHRNDHKQAIRHYRKALAHYKGNATILAALGVSYSKLNKLDEARAILTRLETAKSECIHACETPTRLDMSIKIVEFALREA